MAATDARFALFVKQGLTEEKALETCKNADLAADLEAAINTVGADSLDKSRFFLVYDIVAKQRTFTWLKDRVPFLLGYIRDNKLTTKAQLDAALAFCKACKSDPAEFERECGIGQTVTEADVAAAVAKVFADHAAAIAAERYRFNTGKLLASVRTQLRFADMQVVRDAIDAKLAATLGPKTDADNAPAPKAPKKEKEPAAAAAAAAAAEAPAAAAADAAAAGGVGFQGVAKLFHAPGHNYTTEHYPVTPNTMRLLQEHLARTGGQVRTRFPPEPNGILHIGHGKAINFNFAYARDRSGVCFLRYDDTNPEKEEEEFFVGIKRDVEWLGHTPYKITHSSDYFPQLYEFAVQLIKQGDAYICHQQVDELRGHENREHSPWRERPVAESLALFEDMKHGKIDEGKATLRLKHIMDDGKIDPVAYRIKFCPHHRTGDTWCIYPTYDYTHCICDSLEDITHSLCTKEFQIRRSSYYWLCNKLNIYCPVQWEYSRLNLTHTLVSKRKIGALITKGIVRGWDDPRLFTLAALRRRGFPPAAINAFCELVGVTESTVIYEPDMLEQTVRQQLESTAPRGMGVLAPLRVDIANFAALPAEAVANVVAGNLPGNDAAGSHALELCSVVYIEQGDFAETPEKGFKRFSPAQTVGLKYAGLVLTCTGVTKDDAGAIVGVTATAAPLTSDNKPKGFIHWVSSASPDVTPRVAEVRYYRRLFTHPNPDNKREVPGGPASVVSPDSLSLYSAFIDSAFANAKIGDVFQFERSGYYAVDLDTTPERLVFNLTVQLKEDASAKRK